MRTKSDEARDTPSGRSSLSSLSRCSSLTPETMQMTLDGRIVESEVERPLGDERQRSFSRSGQRRHRPRRRVRMGAPVLRHPEELPLMLAR